MPNIHVLAKLPALPIAAADEIDTIRHLVGAAWMAVSDFDSDDRGAACLKALLQMIESRLVVLTRGGARA